MVRNTGKVNFNKNKIFAHKHTIDLSHVGAKVKFGKTTHVEIAAHLLYFPHKKVCLAKGKSCNSCGRLNHFSIMCLSKPQESVKKIFMDNEDLYAHTVTNQGHNNSAAELNYPKKLYLNLDLKFHKFYKESFHCIPKPKLKALQNIRKDQSRLLISADKGNFTVVMDRKYYDDKVQQILGESLSFL